MQCLSPTLHFLLASYCKFFVTNHIYITIIYNIYTYINYTQHEELAMVEIGQQTYTVKKGDCAWKVAERRLEANGKQASSAEITKEMMRLAKLNGCDNISDFNNKFFGKIGSEFLLSEQAIKDKNTLPAGYRVEISTPDTVALQDNTKIARRDSVVPFDSTKVTSDEILQQLTSRKGGNPEIKKAEKPLTAEEREIARINSLATDTDRIIEYNKKNYNGEYYGIVDKKSCKLKIYDKNGKVVQELTVGVGKKIGDQLGTYYMERVQKTKDAWKAEQGRYTTPGEFTMDELTKATPDYTSKKDGKPKVMMLKGDNRGIRSGNQAIHMVPNSHQDRNAKLDSPTTADNRMSYGCVNLKESDYDILAQYIGEGDKVYILPEEKGNKLLLEQQHDGSYKFEQQYHKDQKRGIDKELASRVKYDVRPERDPVYIAKQKAEQERLLAEQKKNEFCWYNPMTWFS